MKDIRLYEQILEIERPWQVERVSLNKEKKELEVEITFKGTGWACPKCHERMHIHGYRPRRWRHLDSCQFKTIIKYDVPRVRCDVHGTQMVQVPWASKGSRFSLLFERFAIDVLQECSISASCDLLRITWDEADGIKQRAVKRGLSLKDAKVCPHLGVDEKSFGRGHDYVTLVTSSSSGKTTVEYVGDGRSQESLDAYWASLSQEQLEAIRSVSMDMWEAYINSTLSNVSNAVDKIVFDRFHIMKHMNDAVNDVRKLEHRTLSKAGDNTLAGTRQIWLYAEENIPDKYELKLDELKGKVLKTARAWSIKEYLRFFWDYGSVDEGREYFNDWYKWAIRSQLKPVIKVAKMMKKRLRNILTYFKHHVTNAASEGINNKIQALIKKAYGYRNKERFKTDILFHCGGLNLYPEITQ